MSEELTTRIRTVVALLIGGASRAEIVTFGIKPKPEGAGWEVSPEQIDVYILAAKAELAKLATVDPQEELGKAIARLNDLYQRCLKIQDYKASLATQKELHVLLGLNAKKGSRSGGRRNREQPPKLARIPGQRRKA